MRQRCATVSFVVVFCYVFVLWFFFFFFCPKLCYYHACHLTIRMSDSCFLSYTKYFPAQRKSRCSFWQWKSLAVCIYASYMLVVATHKCLLYWFHRKALPSPGSVSVSWAVSSGWSVWKWFRVSMCISNPGSRLGRGVVSSGLERLDTQSAEAAQSLNGATSPHSDEWSSVGLSDVNFFAWSRCLLKLTVPFLWLNTCRVTPPPPCHSVPWLRSETRNNWKWCLPFLGAWRGPIGFPRCLQHCSISAVCTWHSHRASQQALGC